MGGRKTKMIKKTESTTWHFRNLIIDYVDNKIFVNRRYQRKLVWTIREKCDLIDSIMNNIPVPTLFVAKYNENGKEILEVIDGLQRLDAILSFMLGRYGIFKEDKYYYFDPSVDGELQALVNAGVITTHSEYLSKEDCQEFMRKEIPVIYTSGDPDEIDLIFNRLNSTGRKMSPQDKRQSTSNSIFADLVRRISSTIRRDMTFTDRINISAMPGISIGDKKYGYGVNMDTLFWRRHSLIEPQELKESEDEKVIAEIVSTLIMGEYERQRFYLDKLYNEDTITGKKINDIISRNKINDMVDLYYNVFVEIDKIFDSVGSNFTNYLQLSGKTYQRCNSFKILYMALFRLLDDGFVIGDYGRMAIIIRDHKDLFTTGVSFSYSDINYMIKKSESVYHSLVNGCVRAIDRIETEMEKEIDEVLNTSLVESSRVEFKIGISNFATNKVTSKFKSRLLKGLERLARGTGTRYLIVGVADNQKSYNNWYDSYEKPSILMNGHYVTGIEDEAMRMFGDVKSIAVDRYQQHLDTIIENGDMPSELKEYVKMNHQTVTYRDKELLVFKFDDNLSIKNI